MGCANGGIGYLLTMKEGRYGTPERPLSKLGAIAYGRYWQLSVYKYLMTAPDHITMEGVHTCVPW